MTKPTHSALWARNALLLRPASLLPGYHVVGPGVPSLRYPELDQMVVMRPTGLLKKRWRLMDRPSGPLLASKIPVLSAEASLQRLGHAHADRCQSCKEISDSMPFLLALGAFLGGFPVALAPASAPGLALASLSGAALLGCVAGIVWVVEAVRARLLTRQIRHLDAAMQAVAAELRSIPVSPTPSAPPAGAALQALPE